MSPRTRRAFQAILYENFAIAFVGPVLSIAFDKPAASSLRLAFVLSSIALAWNYIFNALFERWEAFIDWVVDPRRGDGAAPAR